jgi:hypothetical protein
MPSKGIVRKGVRVRIPLRAPLAAKSCLQFGSNVEAARVTYPQAVINDVLRLLGEGLSQAEVSRRTGVSRATVRDWSIGHVPRRGAECHGVDERASCPLLATVATPAYAYLLGLYLGDGTISKMRKGVFRLRIFCCDAYPHLQDLCQEAMEAVLPGNRVGRTQCPGCMDISSCSKHWPCLIPQHGPGKKHLRPIELMPWQDDIVRQFPRDFLRGLLHSDGCRGTNLVRGRSGKTYFYPRYEFTNRSEDIKDLFCWACDLLGVEWRVMNDATISINKRADVAFLDTFIGPKT